MPILIGVVVVVQLLVGISWWVNRKRHLADIADHARETSQLRQDEQTKYINHRPEVD